MTREKNNFKIDFIGIGVQRAGTTWIAECLKEHPQICLSRPKEVHFFGTKTYHYGINWYKKHFSPKTNQIVGEFDVGYYSSKEAAQQIKKHFPEVKLITCLRNPIERAFCNYLSVSSFENKNKSFEQVIKENPELLSRGFYYSRLKKYFQLFPRENILVLLYEDMAKNPLEFIQNIYRFLDVDSTFVPQNIQIRTNPSKVYRFPIIKKTTGRIIRYINSRKYGVDIANFFRKIGTKKILILLDKINSKFFNQYPQIKPATRKKLQTLYKQEIKSLEKLINRDLSLWQ